MELKWAHCRIKDLLNWKELDKLISDKIRPSQGDAGEMPVRYFEQFSRFYFIYFQ